ncbi:MAG: hypothetical protein M3R66_18750 [Actinomycetota bacterium]|nr:hypothetical protein [Actinomycetota bacterium]
MTTFLSPPAVSGLASPREVLGRGGEDRELWSLTDRHRAVEVADAVALRAQP